jgi:putative transposase
VSLEDRTTCISLVKEAIAGGAGRAPSCQVLELSLRTLERWEKYPTQGDQRSGPIRLAAHALTAEERIKIIETANLPEHCDLSPWKIVAKMADSGQYLASESSFYRVMREHNLLTHRLKSQPKTRHRPRELVAKNPNQIWSWDITYLKSPIAGLYYYLYLIEDIFSRLIVGWSVEEVESGDHAARLIEAACGRYGVLKGSLTLHSDNGGPMKGATMLSKLQALGVLPSFSRPSVSDDNPFSESLFKTLKYQPSYPGGAFASLDEAREWMRRFVKWYNTEHLHSGIRFVTPQSRHEGTDTVILKNRHDVYENARRLNPLRWSGKTRNWSPITEVHLNPGKELKIKNEMLRKQAA